MTSTRRRVRIDTPQGCDIPAGREFACAGHIRLLALILLALLSDSLLGTRLLVPDARAQSPDASDWGYYGADAFGDHFSSLDEINRGNVSHLEVAWTFRTGELGAGFASADKLSFEATPVLAFGNLYVETPTNIVIALDPVTGKERWRFDPRIDRTRRYSEGASRGVTVWEESDPKRPRGACSHRI